jgi:hypothetical protein
MSLRLLDKIGSYAMATSEDIGCTPVEQVRSGRLCRLWAGTVYGHKVCPRNSEPLCDTAEQAVEAASRFVEECAEIVSERAASKESGNG